jgi:hypothetical protein
MNSRRSALLAMLLLQVVLLVVFCAASSRPPSDHSLNPVAGALIARLADVDTPDIGYSPYDSGSAFAPLVGSNHLSGGLLFPRQPLDRSKVLRELVRLGPAAVPDLLNHLDDERPTRLTVKHTFGSMGGFSINESRADDERKSYTLKVGDLCYVALGQIVNRPYTAVSYCPTAMVHVFTPTRDPATRAALRKEWGDLTPEKHRASLVRDCQGKGNQPLRSGAFARLAYYYPDALEEPAARFLSQPWQSYDSSLELVKKLYKMAEARERKDLFDGYIREFSDAGRDAVRQRLFSDLESLEANEEQRLHPPLKDFGEEPRRLLIELFGYVCDVKARERPTPETASDWHVAEVIEFGLTYDRSIVIDRLILGILNSTTDNQLALACMKRLVGRGYDAAIEAYYRRREAFIEEYSQPRFKEILARAGWSPLHVVVWRDERERLAQLLREGADVNAVGRDGQTPLRRRYRRERPSRLSLAGRRRQSENRRWARPDSGRRRFVRGEDEDRSSPG